MSRSHKASAGATPRPTETKTPSKAPAALYIVATPIGNLADLSTRANETLKAVGTIACEDTRVTGGLLHRFGISTPMLAYHDHNAERMRPQIISRLLEGESFALVSDAGTPLISDPGFKLVKDCVDHGIVVIPIPGPSAPLAALMAAGLPTDRFYFGGFLPLIAAYIVAKTGDPFAGIWYAWGVTAVAFAVAWWGLKGGLPKDFEQDAHGANAG